jgi:hypothetical protein
MEPLTASHKAAEKPQFWVAQRFHRLRKTVGLFERARLPSRAVSLRQRCKARLEVRCVRIRCQETPWDEVRENPAPGGANQLSPGRQRWEKVGEMIRVPEGRPSSHAHISRAVKNPRFVSEYAPTVCGKALGVGLFERARLPSRAVSLRKRCKARLEAEPFQGSGRSF